MNEEVRKGVLFHGTEGSGRVLVPCSIVTSSHWEQRISWGGKHKGPSRITRCCGWVETSEVGECWDIASYVECGVKSPPALRLVSEMKQTRIPRLPPVLHRQHPTCPVYFMWNKSRSP